MRHPEVYIFSTKLVYKVAMLNSTSQSTAEILSLQLANLGVKEVFGVSGANIEDLFVAMTNQNRTNPNKIKIVLAKSESQAALMAMGSYLVHKVPTATLVTSGPGILNCLPILAESFSSQIPLILIAGFIPEHLEGKKGFQDGSGKEGSIDFLKVLQQFTQICVRLKSVELAGPSLMHCFQQAMTHKKPCALVIPKNILGAKIESTADNFRLNTCINQVNSFCELGTIDECSQQILKQKILFQFQQWHSQISSTPLVIVGENHIHLANTYGLLNLIEALNAKVALVPGAKGFFDHSNKRYLGLTGVMGHADVEQFLRLSSDVLVLGSQWDHLSRFHTEEYITDKNCLFFNDDLDVFYKTILPSLPTNSDPAPPPPHIATINPAKRSLGFRNALSIIETAFAKTNDVFTDIFIDAGNVGAFALHALQLRAYPGSLCYTSLAMGGMGNTIGISIGAAIARQNRNEKFKSYVFIGDGSFLISGLEIHTAIQENLPIVFLIFNNNSHGMCSTREQVFFGTTTGLNNFQPSFFGRGLCHIWPTLRNYEVETEIELQQALSHFSDGIGPCVISLRIQVTDETVPFRTFDLQKIRQKSKSPQYELEEPND